MTDPYFISTSSQKFFIGSPTFQTKVTPLTSLFGVRFFAFIFITQRDTKSGQTMIRVCCFFRREIFN